MASEPSPAPTGQSYTPPSDDGSPPSPSPTNPSPYTSPPAPPTSYPGPYPSPPAPPTSYQSPPAPPPSYPSPPAPPTSYPSPYASPPPPPTSYPSPYASPPPPPTSYTSPPAPPPSYPSPPAPPSSTPTNYTSPSPAPPISTSPPTPPARYASPPSPPTNYTSSSPPSPTPTNYTSPPTSPTPPSSGPSVGIIVGIVVGAVASVLLFIILFICYRRGNKNKHQDDEASENNSSSSSSNDIEGPVMPEPQRSPPAPWRPLLLNLNNSSGGETNNPVPPPAGAAYPSPLRIPIGFSKNEFTYEELARATDGFCDANFLGQGGFGCVHRGLLPDGREVAIKQLNAGSSQGEREFQAEVEIISRVHHRHLVSLVGYCITGSLRLLVYEFVPNKTLGFHLHEEQQSAMGWPVRMKIALGAAKGLAYLHENCYPKIIHRDIKATNILLDFKFKAKVADFGLAKFCPDINTHVTTRVMGTLGYLAPEYASSGKLTDKSDVFSFGVVLLELITGRRPVASSHALKRESLVEWALPLLPRALEDENFDILVDPRLQNEYDPNEMVRMVACAAASIRHSAKRRPRMSQIVRALEGEASLADLIDGIRPGQSTVYASGSSDYYDAAQYSEDITKFRKMVLGSGGSSEVSGPTSEYSTVNTSDWSSGESQQRQTTRSEWKRGMRETNNTRGTY